MFGGGELEGEDEEGLSFKVMVELREEEVATSLMVLTEGIRRESTAEVRMGAEMMDGDPDTLSEHTEVGVVSNLLKNRFTSVANSRPPLTPKTGSLQPVLHFIPFHISFLLFCLIFLCNCPWPLSVSKFNSFWTALSSL